MRLAIHRVRKHRGSNQGGIAMRKKFEELEKEREENVLVMFLVMVELVFAIGYMAM